MDLILKVDGLSRQHRHCLAVLCEFNDVAHAARRLHCSQAQVLSRIRELQQLLGPDAVVFADGRVFVDPMVKDRSINGKEQR